jgi:hypothetical protein
MIEIAPEFRSAGVLDQICPISKSHVIRPIPGCLRLRLGRPRSDAHACRQQVERQLAGAGRVQRDVQSRELRTNIGAGRRLDEPNGSHQSLQRILLERIQQAAFRRIPATAAARNRLVRVSGAKESVGDQQTRQINSVKNGILAFEIDGRRTEFLFRGSRIIPGAANTATLRSEIFLSRKI